MTDIVIWLRRDLRATIRPCCRPAADADGGRVLPLFVVDPALWDPAGAPRRAWLVRSLAALSAGLDGALAIRHGDPWTSCPGPAAGPGTDRPGCTSPRTPDPTGGAATTKSPRPCRRRGAR